MAEETAPDGSSVQERLALLEDQVAALLEESGTARGGGRDGRGESGEASASGPARATSSAAAGPRRSSADPAHTASSATVEDPYALLHTLQADAPAPGAVAYVGSVDVGLGHVEYQWGRPADALLEADWAERADALAALGHPLRLAILRLLLDAERTVSEIVDALDLASTGVAYHHLHQLQGAGWVTSPRRGVWTVPPPRIVPLLAIVLAVEEA
ncbi:ArsR/SmtB family transcription factor [Brachybacterium sp. AOP25-B2-12]|uniref:ArsR/SmtB family transcription factor n=1 Tax=Brachybacterium sp. AOP25-B2-12 TaxID=3457710 RepID=UPI004034ADF7